MFAQALTLFGIGAVGTVFWVVSPEVSAVYYGKELGWPSLAVGGLIATAQAPVYLGIFLGGDRLVGRWRWLATKVERTRTRFERHLHSRYLGLTLVAAILGVPPVLAMCALAGPFGVKARHLMPVVVFGRLIRFTTLAGTGGLFS